MKRLVSVVLVLLVFLFAFSACAEGVVIIQSPDDNKEGNTSSNLDDIKIGTTTELDNMILSFASFSIQDELGIYGIGDTESGNEAEYAILCLDVTNLSKEAVDFLNEVEVSVWFNDEYQFGGWAGQFDLDANYSDQVRDDADEQFLINPLYVGHYAMVCMLPNFAVDSKSPMRMEVKINNVSFTYNIRK